MDIDIDFDNDIIFENDRIKTFLQDKLREIQARNEKVKDTIEKRKLLFSSVCDLGNISMSEGSVSVLFSWKKFLNNKCICGFEIENYSKQKLESYKLILDSSTPISYDSYLFEEKNSECCEICTKLTDSFCQSSEILKKGYLVIVINTPCLDDVHTYTIKGKLIFTQDKHDIVVTFPCVEITSLDLTNKRFNELALKNEEICDLLTVIFGSLKTDFVMILPENYTSNVISTFEIHCFLTLVNLPVSCKKYFTAHNICSSFDNSLVVVHFSHDQQVYNLSTYTLNNNALMALLHYFHQHIPGVIMVPEITKHKYDIEKIMGRFDKNCVIETLKTSIKTEVGIVQKYKQYLDCSRVDCDVCMHLRKQLLNAEKVTDYSYLRITSTSK